MIDALSVVSGVKEIAELVKKTNDIPLYQKIVELQAQVVALAEERFQVVRENRELRDKLALKATTEFRNPYFYEQGIEVPLCPKCYSSSSGELRIYLTHPPQKYVGGIGRVCRNCKEFYYEGGSPVGRRISSPGL